jgi:hypothetical protein
MIIEIILGIFIIAFIIDCYIVWNLMKKTERLETWVEDYTGKIEIAYKQMQTIDHRGVFESEDETGDVFKQLKDITAELNAAGLEEENNDN